MDIASVFEEVTMLVDVLIEGGIVLTMNPERRIIEDGSIAIQGNTIVAVGKKQEIRAKYPAPKKVMHAENKLVMPGLINTHVHLIGFPLAKGIRPGNYGYGNPFLQRAYNIFGSPYWNEDRYYLSGLLTCAEMIKNGTTSIVDCGTLVGSEGISIKVIEKTGLRANLALETMDIFEPPGYYIDEKRRKRFGTTQDNLRRMEKFIKERQNSCNGRVKTWACIMQPMNSSDDLIKGLRKLMDEYDIGMTTHANPMRPMTEVVEKAWGKPDTQRFADLGMLDHRCLLAHACDLNGKELMAVRDNHVNLSHQIFTSMNLAAGGSVFARFPQYLEMGINISLGTDDQCCCNHMDMFRTMNATFLVHKESQVDNNLWSPQTVLEMAILNGARSMLLENEVGSLEVGKEADIILVDLMRPEWVPWHKYNLIENLILSATGDSVDTVIVDGRIIMEGREIKTFSERELLTKVQSDIGSLLETLDFLGPEHPYPENLPPLW